MWNPPLRFLEWLGRLRCSCRSSTCCNKIGVGVPPATLPSQSLNSSSIAARSVRFSRWVGVSTKCPVWRKNPLLGQSPKPSETRHWMWKQRMPGHFSSSWMSQVRFVVRLQIRIRKKHLETTFRFTTPTCHDIAPQTWPAVLGFLNKMYQNVFFIQKMALKHVSWKDI